MFLLRVAPLLLTVLASASALAYETCTEENSYLENLLPAEDPTQVTTFPQTCVETAHLTLAPRGYYGFCESPVGQPGRTHPRACISGKYVSAIVHALDDVTDCLGYDIRLAFATFNLESALHLNAVGAATDVGIGQLTKTAIDEVTLNALPRARRMAAASSKHSCQRILPNMTEHSSAIGDRCGFMSLPENPVRNLVYSVLLLQQNRRVVNNLWNRESYDLPNVNSERLKALITMLAYNSGPGGIMATLKGYVQQIGAANLTDYHFHFEGTDEDGFVRYINDNFPSADAGVRKRVSKYIGYIFNSARRVDKLAGGTTQCLHMEYIQPPIKPVGYQSVPAPEPHQAQRIIAANLRKIVDGIKRGRTRGGCMRMQQEFEFMFLGRGQKIKDLPYELRRAYKQLCR